MWVNESQYYVDHCFADSVYLWPRQHLPQQKIIKMPKTRHAIYPAIIYLIFSRLWWILTLATFRGLHLPSIQLKVSLKLSTSGNIEETLTRVWQNSDWGWTWWLTSLQLLLYSLLILLLNSLAAPPQYLMNSKSVWYPLMSLRFLMDMKGGNSISAQSMFLSRNSPEDSEYMFHILQCSTAYLDLLQSYRCLVFSTSSSWQSPKKSGRRTIIPRLSEFFSMNYLPFSRLTAMDSRMSVQKSDFGLAITSQFSRPGDRCTCSSSLSSKTMFLLSSYLKFGRADMKNTSGLADRRLQTQGHLQRDWVQLKSRVKQELGSNHSPPCSYMMMALTRSFLAAAFSFAFYSLVTMLLYLDLVEGERNWVMFLSLRKRNSNPLILLKWLQLFRLILFQRGAPSTPAG